MSTTAIPARPFCSFCSLRHGRIPRVTQTGQRTCSASGHAKSVRALTGPSTQGRTCVLVSHSEVQAGCMAHVFSAKGLGPLAAVKLFGVDFTENICASWGKTTPFRYPQMYMQRNCKPPLPVCWSTLTPRLDLHWKRIHSRWREGNHKNLTLITVWYTMAIMYVTRN